MKMRKQLLLAMFLPLCLLGCSGTGAAASSDTAPSSSNAPADDGLGIGTAPISKRMAAVKSCMEEQGVVVIYDGRGGLSSVEQPDEQGDLWLSVLEECGNAHGLYEPWTVEELKELYKLEVKNHECLLDAGYESDEPSTEQAYIDAWFTKTEPYQSVGAVFDTKDPKVFSPATDLCPAPLWSFG